METIFGLDFSDAIFTEVENENSGSLIATRADGLSVVITKKQLNEDITILAYDITFEAEKGEEVEASRFEEYLNALRQQTNG